MPYCVAVAWDRPFATQDVGPEQKTPRVLTVLSSVIENMVTRNDKLSANLAESVSYLSGRGLKGFHGVRAPSISVSKYLERIYKYTDCSPSCFVLGFVYIDKLTHKCPDSLVQSFNVHRLILTSVMVASKVLDDVHFSNEFYARVGGVSNAEINRLELDLLFLLDFGVTVSASIFESYCVHLEKETMRLGLDPIEKPINDSIDGREKDSSEDLPVSVLAPVSFPAIS